MDLSLGKRTINHPIELRDISVLGNQVAVKKLKSCLAETKMTNAYVIEALINMSAISLMISGVIVDEFYKLDAK